MDKSGMGMDKTEKFRYTVVYKAGTFPDIKKKNNVPHRTNPDKGGMLR